MVTCLPRGCESIVCHILTHSWTTLPSYFLIINMRLSLITLMLLSLSGQAFAQASKPAKKLIEFGWDEPDTAFMKTHLAAMEATPFDGTVYHVLYAKPGGGKGTFSNECWGTRAFSPAELKPAMEDLKSTPFKTFTHNFLRFNVMPGNVDWFDDFTPILTNARLAATVAREGKSAGILFDIEQYESQLFNYAKARDVKTKSYDVYAKQAHQRGKALMEAFQEGFPDLTVFLTFGYSLPMAETNTVPEKLATTSYGLLKPLLDGMFEAAKGKAIIVDGFEISYGYKDPKEFDDAVVIEKQKALPMIADVAKFKQYGQLGFGIWMDQDWRKYGWDVADVTKNYFTAEQFESSVRKALDTADQYVWIYTETPRWWSEPEGKPVKLPKAYEDALRRAAGK